jgi:hypothetical protein
MNFNAVGSGSSLSAYVNSLMSKTGADSSSTAAPASGTSASTQAAAQAALAAASHGFKATSAQHRLEQKQTTLAGDLRSAMAKAGVALGGSVEFSVGSDGKLAVAGSDKDKAGVAAFLKADTSRPSFTSRVTSLAGEADALSGSLWQSAAISQAARYGGKSGQVMSLYGSLLQQQDTTPAVFSLSATTSAITYPGVLTSKA